MSDLCSFLLTSGTAVITIHGRVMYFAVNELALTSFFAHIHVHCVFPEEMIGL